MQTADARVLHVLPHPGGGGESYIAMLDGMDGYVAARTYVAPSPRGRTAIAPAVASIVRIPLAASRCDLLHVHGEVVGALSLPALARRPAVVTLHGMNLVRRASGLGLTLARANLRAVIRAADCTICVSAAELDEIRTVDPALAKRCIVIPNGVDLPPPPTASERQAARAALGIDDGTSLSLWVGALDVPKQPQVAVRAVIDAARQDASIQLAIVGDGPLRHDAELAASERPGTARFFGHRRDLRPFLAAADLFILSSAREGLPFSLLEAMAMGLPPVVAVGGEGMEEAVSDAGLVVRERDIPALARAVLALATQPELRARLGHAARARVAEHFRAEQMRDRTRGVYDRVLAARRSG
jgi:glycosyltransferase involved in cell wall biosynthesis